MTRLEEYFERKRIMDLALPKLYIVKSTRCINHIYFAYMVFLYTFVIVN